MYEKLTEHIPVFEEKGFAGWAKRAYDDYFEPDEARAPEQPVRKTAVKAVWNSIVRFNDEHPEFRLKHYMEILEEKGIKPSSGEETEWLDLSALDGQAVMAILFTIYRMDHFDNGSYLLYVANGTVLRCLKRLEELDGPKEDRQQRRCGIVCFYSEKDAFGAFSNWVKSPFTYAELEFSCVEQFMMYHKLSVFGQKELTASVMAAGSPAEMKKLGRTHFKNFDSELWGSICYAIVKRGVRAKFEQNDKLLELLLATGEDVLAEASLTDRRWGIGVAADDLARFYPNCWTGSNYMGRILMEVRSELKSAKLLGTLGYVSARDKDFSLWHEKAGTLLRIPRFHDTVNAYVRTFRYKDEKKEFLYEIGLAQFELHARKYGELTSKEGFFELKQDLFDSLRLADPGFSYQEAVWAKG